MDVFDRLGDLLKSLLQEDEREYNADPDFVSAWEELDSYIAGDERFSAGSTGKSSRYAGRKRSARGIPEELRQDYRNLEVEFGAPLETVRRSYRSLMVMYHPDRFASNRKKSQIATEITKKLGESYRRIRSYYEASQ